MTSTHQHPIESRFDLFSTSTQVMAGVSLAGDTAIVTGGYSGLGLEMVRCLVDAGARVVVPARDPARAAQALDGIAGVEVSTLDLADPASIDGFAARFLAGARPVRLLVNGAGIMATPLARDAQGHEAQFSTNQLGHFRLTCRLWPALVAARGARVVTMSSRAHQIAPIDFEDVDFERRPYDKWVAYGQSKTANALFAVGLDARGRRHGVRAFSVHPGSILGPLARHLSAEEIGHFGALDAQGQAVIDPARDMKNVAQGAATPLWCATSHELAGLGGAYCEDCNIAAPLPEPARGRGVRPWATDATFAERLWALSEHLTGVRLD